MTLLRGKGHTFRLSSTPGRGRILARFKENATMGTTKRGEARV